MHTLHNDPQEHLSEDTSILWIFGACPLLAVTDTLTDGLGISLAMLTACVLGTVVAALLLGRLQPLWRLTASMIVLSAIVSSMVLVANAWLPSLHTSLGIFPSLIAANLLLISRMQLATAAGVWRATRQSLASFAPVLLVLLVLSALRELVGRGSLFHNVGLIGDPAARSFEVQLFSADLGFLLGLLPPGAFISFAVLLALRNWLRRHALNRAA